MVFYCLPFFGCVSEGLQIGTVKWLDIIIAQKSSMYCYVISGLITITIIIKLILKKCDLKIQLN